MAVHWNFGAGTSTPPKLTNQPRGKIVGQKCKVATDYWLFGLILSDFSLALLAALRRASYLFAFLPFQSST